MVRPKRDSLRSEPEERAEVVATISNVDHSRVVITGNLLLGKESLELLSCIRVKKDRVRRARSRGHIFVDIVLRDHLGERVSEKSELVKITVIRP